MQQIELTFIGPSGKSHRRLEGLLKDEQNYAGEFYRENPIKTDYTPNKIYELS